MIRSLYAFFTACIDSYISLWYVHQVQVNCRGSENLTQWLKLLSCQNGSQVSVVEYILAKD